MQMESYKEIFVDDVCYPSKTDDNLRFFWVIKKFSVIGIKDILKNNDEPSMDKCVKSKVFSFEHSDGQIYAWQMVLWPRLKSGLGDIVAFSLLADEKKLQSHVWQGKIKASLKQFESNGDAIDFLEINYGEASGWNWTGNLRNNIISREMLFNIKERFLNEDELKIECRIDLKLKHSIKESHLRCLQRLNPLRFQLDLKYLFEKQINCDVTIKCGEEKFPAHKAILSARSSVFSRMFRNPSAEHIVDVLDIGGSVMKILLKYMYGIEIEIQSSMYLELYHAADKYNLQEVKQHSSYLIMCDMNVNNVWDIAVFADAHHDDRMLSMAEMFVKNNSSDLMSKHFMDFVIKSRGTDNRLLDSLQIT